MAAHGGIMAASRPSLMTAALQALDGKLTRIKAHRRAAA
jgi:hypothetical protein